MFESYDSETGVCFANIRVTAEWLCKELGVTFEIWTKEEGCCFQEHYYIDENGERIIDDCVKYEPGHDYDEEGNIIDRNEDKDVGGFKNWGEWE